MKLMCFVWISVQTANFALHSIIRFVFITEVETVYCAVRTESLCNIDTSCLQKVNVRFDCWVCTMLPFRRLDALTFWCRNYFFKF